MFARVSHHGGPCAVGLAVGVGHARNHRGATQAPELLRGQILLFGCELPAHVAGAASALGYGPGIAETRVKISEFIEENPAYGATKRNRL